jgi:hypothetical protein
MGGTLAVLGDCSEGFFVIRLIFKAAFVRRPGPYNSDKAPGNDSKKGYRDKQISASELHRNTFRVQEFHTVYKKFKRSK